MEPSITHWTFKGAIMDFSPLESAVEHSEAKQASNSEHSSLMAPPPITLQRSNAKQHQNQLK